MKALLNEDPTSSDDDLEERSAGEVGDGVATTTTPDIQEEDTPSTPSKVSNPNGDVVITIPHRQCDWFFPGFMFVLLYGPFSENIEAKRSMEFFLNKDPAVTSSTEKKSYGRSKMREVKQEEAMEASKRRAISIGDELRIAGLEFKQASLQLQNARVIIQDFESKLMAKKLEMDGIRSLMEAATQMAKATNDWTTWKRLFEQYETCQKEMRALSAEHESQKGRLNEVRIPSLAGFKRQAVHDDEAPVKEISTEERSSGASQLSSPASTMNRQAKQNSKN